MGLDKTTKQFHSGHFYDGVGHGMGISVDNKLGDSDHNEYLLVVNYLNSTNSREITDDEKLTITDCALSPGTDKLDIETKALELKKEFLTKGNGI